MSSNNLYDPEDFEKLLVSKSFSELLPEEKAFVLQYVDNDIEYDAMRKTYGVSDSLPEIESTIEPSPASKEYLMEAFSKAHSPQETKSIVERIRLWLWNTENVLFQRPAFQLASLALVVSLGVIVSTFNTEIQVAELKVEEATDKKEQVENETENLEVKSDPEQKEDIQDKKVNEQNISESLIQRESSEEKVLDESVEAEEGDKTEESLSFKSDDLQRLENITNANGDFSLDVADSDHPTVELLVATEDAQEDHTDDEAINSSLLGSKDFLSYNETTTTYFTSPGLTDSGSTTNIIYNDGTYKESEIEFDGRTDFGNATSITYDINEFNKTAINLSDEITEEIDISAKKYSEVTQPAMTASSFSHLIYKLHTSQ